MTPTHLPLLERAVMVKITPAMTAAARVVPRWAPPDYQRQSERIRVVPPELLGHIERHVSDAPDSAAARATAAWRNVRRAAARVVGYQHLHLYRTEYRADLSTRGVVLPDGLHIDEFGQTEFDALSREERAVLIERIEVDEANWRERWRCGDLTVLARLAGRPSGMTWCVRSPVMVPEVGREVRPAPSECYMHEGFVTPDARGKNIWPAMLEDLGRRMGARDVHTAWTLIHRANVASARGVHKVAYARVADVIYARIGPFHRLVLRPPDPAVKRFLGIP